MTKQWLSGTSIRNKLRLLLSMSVLFMFMFAGCLLIINSFLSNKSVLTHETNALAEVTKLSVLPSLIFDNNQDAQQTLDTLKAHRNIIYAAIITPNNNNFAVFENHKFSRFDDKINIDCENKELNFNSLYICKSLVYEDVNYGRMVLVVSLKELYQRLQKDLFLTFLGLLLASWIVYLVLDIFAKKMTDPILKLLEISELVSHSGKYDKRVLVTSKDEIGRLGEAFNIMMDKIQNWNETLIDQKSTLEDLVTERTQEKNKALKLAEEANRANKAKSEFLSVMSHEIRTPLNAIIGFSDLIKTTTLNDTQQEYIDIITESGNSLLVQINDILDFSKIEAGKMELNQAWFDLYELLSTAIVSNRYESQLKSLNLKHFMDPELPRYVYGDEQKIKQILYNLLNNAVKFTEEGHVSLNIKIHQNVNDNLFIDFVIIDTGIGIDETKQAILFDAFTQVDATNTRKYGGTGLGLAIVKSMVEFLGGSISLQSELGLGTEFLVRLPFLINVVQENTLVQAKKIALVDNISESSLLIQLRNLGYCVETVLLTGKDKFDHTIDYSKICQLILFSEACAHQANLYFKHHRHSAMAYCTENEKQDSLMHDLPCINIRHDKLNMIEQIKRLLKPETLLKSSAKITTDINILVAEDNPVNMMMIQEMLKSTSLNILTAQDGQQAVNIYKTHKVDLILMDCQMPVMDGYMATSEIRQIEQETFQHIPIIALTANAFKDDMDECIAMGMDGYLSKPFKVDKLFSILELYLEVDNEMPILEKPDNLTVDFTLDFELVEQLIKMDKKGTKTFIRQISQAYFANANRLMENMEVAIAQSQYKIIKACAHQLKSSSMNVAAKKISELFEALEDITRADNAAEMIKTWKLIKEEYQRVRIAYKELLQD